MINGKYSELKRKYNDLKLKYISLRYKVIGVKENLKRDYPSLVSALFLFAIGIAGLLYFKKTVIIELGLI
ncbi:MAG: hypothetical protein PHU12_03710, partial [Candidatus Aenigmarchaeota archaeon]|nr:hypothetical protein [Candidatus Aenigmarchaeota archaeon]